MVIQLITDIECIQDLLVVVSGSSCRGSEISQQIKRLFHRIDFKCVAAVENADVAFHNLEKREQL